jgi:hypothetical protein
MWCPVTRFGLKVSHTFPIVAKHLDFLHILLDADIFASYAIVCVNAHNICVCIKVIPHKKVTKRFLFWDILFAS